ncbi:MAG: hypothetical protein ACO3IW_10405 [Burkholderiales bacterium]
MTSTRRIASAIALASLLTVQPAVAADVPDGLEATRSLARSGALQLALQRVDMLQPADTAGPRWAEWQLLRLQLLAESGRHEELIRHAALPGKWTEPSRVELHALAAQSALALGRAAAARDHAARALWTDGIDAAHIRRMRLLVIRSYVQEGKADEAYRSMLRFQQDYRPLDAETATEFVHALLDLGLAGEAVNWLGLLDERGAAKLRLRLHTGLVKAPDAIAQARAALARSDEPQWWRIILDAAKRQPVVPALEIEARERLLNYKDQPAAAASVLWENYAGYARGNANLRQLLAGDEPNWLEFALQRRAAEPAVARAYLGFLVRHAQSEPVRRRAQEELAAAFEAAGLPSTALRLFAAWPGDAGRLTVSTRHILGGLAGKLDDPVRALDYWNGLPAPIDVPLLSWEVRLASLALRAGRTAMATDMARKLSDGRPAIPPSLLPEWLVLARQFSDHGLANGALVLYEAALPHAGTQADFVLAGMAQVYESDNLPLLAADYYLRSALRAAAPDAAAGARLRAGLALVRAGLRDDARAQFEWLLQHAKDPALLSVARRELGR